MASFFMSFFYSISYSTNSKKPLNKTINVWLNNSYDECALIFYCDNLHYCHNMNIMIDGTITLLLACYLGINIALTRLTCIFQYHL